jgi:hypothetical protein
MASGPWWKAVTRRMSRRAARLKAGIWWIPNLSWFQIVLKRLGFSQVEVVDRFTHTVRPADNRVETTVLRARRGPG